MFHQTKTIHRCLDGCGALVTGKGRRCAACHAAHVSRLRSPEERSRIGRIASAAATAARIASANSPYKLCATSRFL